MRTCNAPAEGSQRGESMLGGAPQRIIGSARSGAGAKNHRGRHLPILALAMLSVAACDTIRDAYLPDAAIITEERKEVGGKPGPINLDTYRFTFIVEFPGAKPPSPPAEDPAPSPVGNDSGENGIVLRGPVTSGGTLAYHGAVMAQVVAVSSGDVANKRVAKVLRNMLQSKFRDRSDQVCDFHLAGILGYSATANFVTGLLATSLSALSAAFTGNAAKTALSTSAAIIGGSRAPNPLVAFR